MTVKEYKLSTDGINRMIADLDVIKQKIEHGAEELALRCAKEAENAVTAAYNSALMDLPSPFTVESIGTGQGEYTVVAKGDDIAFREFGAGIAFNPNPVSRPPEVLGIGEYGYGQGKNQDGWIMPDGERTYGNPAVVGFVRAREAIETQIVQITQEVFRG